MKHMKKSRFIYILFVFVFLFTVTSAADIQKKDVEITYKNIVIYNGRTRIVPRDSNGTYIEPFILDGSVYLPLRAVGEAVGYQVDWDHESSTVMLQGKSVSLPRDKQLPSVKLSESTVISVVENNYSKAEYSLTLVEILRGESVLQKHPDALTFTKKSTIPGYGSRDIVTKIDIPQGYELFVVKIKAEVLTGTGVFTDRTGIVFNSSDFQFNNPSSVQKALLNIPIMFGVVLSPGSSADLY